MLKLNAEELEKAKTKATEDFVEDEVLQDDGSVRLSHSQISTYMRCPMQYFYSYIERLDTGYGMGLAFGSAYHKALEHNFKQKITSKIDLPLDDILNVFTMNFDKNCEDIEDKEEREEIPQNKDKGIECVKLYHTQFAPLIQPVEIEKFFRINLGNDEGFTVNLSGYIDLIDADGWVVDHKTAARSYTQFKADTDFQLTAYALAYRNLYGKQEKGMRYDTMVKKKVPELQQLKTTRSFDDVESFRKTAIKVAKAVKGGVFYKRIDVTTCSWCSHCKTCLGKEYSEFSKD